VTQIRAAPEGQSEDPDSTGAVDPSGWRAFAGAVIEREIAAASAASATSAGTAGSGGAPAGGDGKSGDLASAATLPTGVPHAADAAVARAEELLTAAVQATGPLRAIALTADLDDTEIRVLALCAGVELDRRLQRLVGLLQHDPTSGRLEVDQLAGLLGPQAVAVLADDGRLARAALLEVEPGLPLAAARIAVPRRVTWALLDDVSLDPELPLGAELIVPDQPHLGLHDLVLVSGPDRVRRVQAGVGSLSGAAFLLTAPPADDQGWRTLVRQATVAALAVVLECPSPLEPLARHWIERADHLSFAVCTPERMPLDCVPKRAFAEVRADHPAVRDAEWQAVFPGSELPRRRPTAAELRLAATVRRPGDEPQEALRRVATGALLRHARRVVPAASWDDLVLPTAQQRQLRGLAARYHDRSMVHEQWGLPLFPSPGMVALFAGPSGTGKSTAAEVIAGQLGVEMFRVDLSALVSKYIGETEKNLEEIFSAAHSGDYLLLFDEADALFGARSKVTDARDRYANMEVSYLLQRLESYDGFVILTSNFQGNIDEAFLRRIHVAVHFTVPTEQDRCRIWERSLAGAPRSELDLAFVAKKFDLTGGSIRMAALSAAYLAARRGKPIGMSEVLEGVSQEMTKLRRRSSDDQFGRWLPEVAENLA
jgi:hypothetical protein